MKSYLLPCLLAAISLPASAAVVYVDLADVAIPGDLDGVYINILTGATDDEMPTDFNTAPWINLFHGGTEIATSELLRPWASVSTGYDIDQDHFVNLAFGTVIDSSGSFVTGESGSYLHVGPGGNQFQSGISGYLAFEYQSSVASGTSYGWLRFSPSTSGSGFSADLAYSDTPGETLTVGAIPEPSTFAALMGVFGLSVAALRRRRSV